MFLIISPEDIVVYQIYTNLIKKEVIYTQEFIVFASLDLMENMEISSNSMYLKTVDKFNEYQVSGFCTAGKMKFVLLYEIKINEESIKSFFYDVYEYYCKCLMNPFIDKNSKIFSAGFDSKVKLAFKKHIG